MNTAFAPPLPGRSAPDVTPRIREPNGFWEWCAAVDKMVCEDGVQTTAHAWALHCVIWKGDECRLRTPHVGVEELARRRHRDRTAIRRHLIALEELGLLELVQRHGNGRKRLYLARVPIEYGAPEDPHPPPGWAEGAYRAAAPGNHDSLTGQQRPVIPGSSAPSNRAAAPASPSYQSSQISSRAAGMGLPGSSTRLLEQEEEPKSEDEPGEVLDQLSAKVPAVMAQADVATRGRIAGRVRTLHRIGWQSGELVRELTRASLDGTRSPVGALMSRLDGLVETGAEELQRLRDEQAARQTKLEHQRAHRDADDADEREQRDEAERWADELASAMPADELAELLDLVVAEHYPHLTGRGPMIMRQGVPRAWLREEYSATGEDRPLPTFLIEVRVKLTRDLADVEAAT